MNYFVAAAASLIFLASGSASAAMGPAAADEGDEGNSDAARAKTGTDKREDLKWIDRWAPERNMVELGVFGGVAFPSRQLELFEPDLMLPDQGFKRLRRPALDLGGRVGFYPLRFLGVEVEGAVIPTRTDADDQGVLMWAFRGHLIGQLPLWSVTPFVVAGPSVLGVASPRDAVGNDADLGFHFGAGVKIFLNRYVALRFDVRDTLTAEAGIADGVGHTPELLLGLSVTLNRAKRRTRVGDRDQDGILDPDDECIDVPGVPENDGCPLGDRDEDGILDVDDHCVDVPGVPENFGCPIADADEDGIADAEDDCVNDPENKNGYEDEDGCPEEIPEAIQEFSGVIEGIFFDTNRATIKRTSRKKLNHAVEVLKQFETVRLEISGHTDDRGDEDYNMDLSGQRAEAVRKYLTDRGIDADRLETRGAGESTPLAANTTDAGRAKNRRIEFKLLSK